MLTSVLSPINVRRPEPMPWDWNPAQTFVTNYRNAQEDQRAKQEFALGMQLEQILLPAKIAKAEYDTKKFTYDAQLLEKIYRTQSAALDNSYRGVTSAVGGGGQSGAVVNGPANNTQQPQQQLGYSNRLKKTGAGTMGSGLKPIGDN